MFALRSAEGLGPEQLSWASRPRHRFTAPFFLFLANREGRGIWAGGLTGSHLFIAGIWGHVVLGAEAAGCLALPANHSAAGPRVSHMSRCPDVTPQRWPGLWPDAQHSLLTPGGPLGDCQVSTGAEVGGHKGRKEERAVCRQPVGPPSRGPEPAERQKEGWARGAEVPGAAMELLGPSVDVPLG